MDTTPDNVARPEEQGIDLIGMWNVVWDGKWLIVACGLLFGLGAGVYAFMAQPWYRAEVLLTPAESKNMPGLAGGLGGLGGLASLAGINVGDHSTVEPLAVSTSRDFLRDFIRKRNLLPVLFADKWNAASGTWNVTDPKKQPDLYDGVRKIKEKVLSVREDIKTRLVTVTVDWTDAATAASWANGLVDDLNERMRQRALVESEANVKFLQQQLSQSNVVSLQQSMGRLIESEMQQLMLAQGNAEFAFRIIDRAEAPKLREHPKRVQLIAIGGITGGLLAVFILFFRRALRRELAQRATSAS